MKDTNHCISKAIVEFAYNHNAGTVSFEKLSGIREDANKKGKRLRSSINSWSYHQLQTFTEYKALEHGIHTVYVDPRNTSKTCSKCGEIGQRVGDRFSCVCGYTLHADLNGARNIRARHMGMSRMSAGCKSFTPEIPSQPDHRLVGGISRA